MDTCTVVFIIQQPTFRMQAISYESYIGCVGR